MSQSIRGHITVLEQVVAEFETRLEANPNWVALRALNGGAQTIDKGTPAGEVFQRLHLERAAAEDPIFKARLRLIEAILILGRIAAHESDAAVALEKATGASGGTRGTHASGRAGGEPATSTCGSNRVGPVVRDELTRIRGVDDVLAGKLYALGVERFADIAAWTGAERRRIGEILDLGRTINRQNWIEQAALLASASEGRPPDASASASDASTPTVTSRERLAKRAPENAVEAIISLAAKQIVERLSGRWDNASTAARDPVNAPPSTAQWPSSATDESAGPPSLTVGVSERESRVRSDLAVSAAISGSASDPGPIAKSASALTPPDTLGPGEGYCEEDVARDEQSDGGTNSEAPPMPKNRDHPDAKGQSASARDRLSAAEAESNVAPTAQGMASRAAATTYRTLRDIASRSRTYNVPRNRFGAASGIAAQIRNVHATIVAARFKSRFKSIAKEAAEFGDGEQRRRRKDVVTGPGTRVDYGSVARKGSETSEASVEIVRHDQRPPPIETRETVTEAEGDRTKSSMPPVPALPPAPAIAELMEPALRFLKRFRDH